jgi:hypothetical protein
MHNSVTRLAQLRTQLNANVDQFTVHDGRQIAGMGVFVVIVQQMLMIVEELELTNARVAKLSSTIERNAVLNLAAAAPEPRWLDGE